MTTAPLAEILAALDIRGSVAAVEAAIMAAYDTGKQDGLALWQKTAEAEEQERANRSAREIAADNARDADRLTKAEKLTAIGWQWETTPYVHATDPTTGAVRIADRWGDAPEGYWYCGSRGPGGQWPTFDAAVDAAWRFHVLHEDVDGSNARTAEDRKSVV